MSRLPEGVPLKEKSNQPGGRSGSGPVKKTGPAVGRASGNKTKGGGVMEPTKGRRG